MSHDAESVRSVWREVLSDDKLNDVRNRDGYLYAAKVYGNEDSDGYYSA